MGDGNLLTISQHATMHASHGYAACIAAEIQRGDKHLRRSLYLLRSRNHLNNLIQQIRDVGCWLLPILAHPTILG